MNSYMNTVQDLLHRMKNNSNGVVAILQSAGISTTEPTLADVYKLMNSDSENYNKLMKFLYAADIIANADGATDTATATTMAASTTPSWMVWANSVSGALASFFSTMTGQGSTASEQQAILYAQMQAQQQAAQSQKIMTTIAIAIGVLIVIAVVFIFLKKKK